MEHHLAQDVAEFLFERRRCARVRRVAEVIDRLDRLVALLDEMTRERVVRLLAVPRAAFAQLGDDRFERGELPTDRCPKRRQIDAGQMVRDDAIELLYAEMFDAFVFESQVMEDNRLGRFATVVVERQLDLRKRLRIPDVREQHRSGVPRGVDPEPLAVDEAHGADEGVDAESWPGEVEEREPLDERQLDAVIGNQHLDGRLEHARRAGHGVDDAAFACGGIGDLGDDRPVRRRKVRAGFVVAVERDRAHLEDRGSGGMASRAQVDRRCAFERRLCLPGEQLRPRRAEADNRQRPGAPR